MAAIFNLARIGNRLLQELSITQLSKSVVGTTFASLANLTSSFKNQLRSSRVSAVQTHCITSLDAENPLFPILQPREAKRTAPICGRGLRLLLLPIASDNARGISVQERGQFTGLASGIRRLQAFASLCTNPPLAIPTSPIPVRDSL